MGRRGSGLASWRRRALAAPGLDFHFRRRCVRAAFLVSERHVLVGSGLQGGAALGISFLRDSREMYCYICMHMNARLELLGTRKLNL